MMPTALSDARNARKWSHAKTCGWDTKANKLRRVTICRRRRSLDAFVDFTVDGKHNKIFIADPAAGATQRSSWWICNRCRARVLKVTPALSPRKSTRHRCIPFR
jgi:hypothetical protein